MSSRTDCQPLTIVGAIDHVTIISADLDRTREFYTGVLGMKRVERPDFGFDGLWFEAGATQIHVNPAGKHGGRAGIPDGGARMPSIGFHLAFWVDDCRQAADRLAAAGIELIDGPRSRPDGVMQFYIYDPDGHLIEICSGPSAGGADP
jgi:catechol 2,3-dioxygenase-like lactoylglutathione lyase family enzyme